MSGEQSAVENKAAGLTHAPIVATRGAKLLLILTTTVFVLWVGAMIAMYVKTVYPQRHPTTAPTTGIKIN